MVSKFDSWLSRGGAAALVVREYLMPVEGDDGVLFPPTFAPSDDKAFQGGYNIDEFGDGTNVCLIDSVGSQANRIEPLFMYPPYDALVPQVTITAGRKRVNLLEAGHRAGDAIVRCTPLQQELRDAFIAVQRGNAEPLARVAPTSLVFGAWDSRDTQAKVPRLVSSTIRAFNVRRLTRSAQYVPATEYVKEELLEDPADKQAKTYAERGFVHVPATGTPGGVIATGGVRRDATLHLAALRLLFADQESRSTALRRYLLGLALTAFSSPAHGYLRQGCSLVPDRSKGVESTVVHADGRREPLSLLHDEALEYAKVTANAFGVAGGREVPFDVDLAKQDVSGDAEGGARSRKSKKAR